MKNLLSNDFFCFIRCIHSKIPTFQSLRNENFTQASLHRCKMVWLMLYVMLELYLFAVAFRFTL